MSVSVQAVAKLIFPLVHGLQDAGTLVAVRDGYVLIQVDGHHFKLTITSEEDEPERCPAYDSSIR